MIRDRSTGFSLGCECALKTQVRHISISTSCLTATHKAAFLTDGGQTVGRNKKTECQTLFTTFGPMEPRNRTKDTVNHFYVKRANYPESLTFVGQSSGIEI